MERGRASCVMQFRPVSGERQSAFATGAGKTCVHDQLIGRRRMHACSDYQWIFVTPASDIFITLLSVSCLLRIHPQVQVGPILNF